MIGCGGGTLRTMLTRAGQQVSIVEINPVSFTLAKRYFQYLGMSNVMSVTDVADCKRRGGAVIS